MKYKDRYSILNNVPIIRYIPHRPRDLFDFNTWNIGTMPSRFITQYGELYELKFITPESKHGNFRNDYPKFYLNPKDGQLGIPDKMHEFLVLASKQFELVNLRCCYHNVYNPQWKTTIWHYFWKDGSKIRI